MKKYITISNALALLAGFVLAQAVITSSILLLVAYGCFITASILFGELEEVHHD